MLRNVWQVCVAQVRYAIWGHARGKEGGAELQASGPVANPRQSFAHRCRLPILHRSSILQLGAMANAFVGTSRSTARNSALGVVFLFGVLLASFSSCAMAQGEKTYFGMPLSEFLRKSPEEMEAMGVELRPTNLPISSSSRGNSSNYFDVKREVASCPSAYPYQCTASWCCAGGTTCCSPYDNCCTYVCCGTGCCGYNSECCSDGGCCNNGWKCAGGGKCYNPNASSSSSSSSNSTPLSSGKLGGIIGGVIGGVLLIIIGIWAICKGDAEGAQHISNGVQQIVENS